MKNKSLIILINLVAFLSLSACSSTMPSKDAVLSPEQAMGSVESYLENEEYILQVGDNIDVKLYYNSDLNENLVIRPDGKISLQLIGDIQAAGLSPQKLSENLSRKFELHIKNPEVAVIVKTFKQHEIFVAGEVNRPGVIDLRRGMTVLQAVLKSGGFTYEAEQRSVIVLRNADQEKPTFIRMDFKEMMEPALPKPGSAAVDQDMEEEQVAMTVPKPSEYARDMQLQPLDIIFVPETRISSVAQFFGRYFNKIVPIYGNMGLSFTYEVYDD